MFDSNGNCIVGSYWNSAKQWIYQGNVTLYAQWRQNAQQYVLTVDPNGGYLNGGNFGSDNGYSWSTSVTVTRGKSAYYSLGRATRSGYTFTGWWTSPSGGTRVFDSNGNCIVGNYWNSSKQWIYRGNITLYAQWQACSYQRTSTSGNGLWTRFSDGSWRSGSIGDGQSTSIARTVSGARTVTFKWKTSSEEGYDKLAFYIDGMEIKSISGETSWTTESINVAGNGMHTIRWTYSKDGSVSSGSDCGWIDDIRW